MLTIKTDGPEVKRIEATGTLDLITTELVYSIAMIYGALRVANKDKADLFQKLLRAAYGSANGTGTVFNPDIEDIIRNEALPVKVVLVE